MAAKIKYAKGSIGYVEYGVAKGTGLAMAVLENRMGHYVKPGDTSGTAALENTSDRMPANLRLFIPYPSGRNSYPIITFTWMLVYQSYADPVKTEGVKRFFHWGLPEGQKFAPEYGYAPLPQRVAALAVEDLAEVR